MTTEALRDRTGSQLGEIETRDHGDQVLRDRCCVTRMSTSGATTMSAAISLVMPGRTSWRKETSCAP